MTSLTTFIQYAISWRQTGGMATQLGVLGISSANSTGNVAHGDAVFPARTTGINNAGFGKGALANITSGSNNWAIGTNAGADLVFNLTSQSNAGVLGNNQTQAIYAKVALTVTSDERDKTAFVPIDWTAEAFSNIKTGAFRFVDRQTGLPTSGWRYGFSAQNLVELEQQLPSGKTCLVDFSDAQSLKLNESQMLPILVVMVQSLMAEVEKLKQRLDRVDDVQ